MCPKHAESNKTGNKKYCGVISCWYLLMNYPTMHGIQNIKFTSFRLHKKKKLIPFSQFAIYIFFTRAPSFSKPVVASLRVSISLVLIILHPLNPNWFLCVVSMYVPYILCTVFISTNHARYIFFILAIFLLWSLLHVSIYLYHPQGVPSLYFVKVT
jgi:hypothetical protein